MCLESILISKKILFLCLQRLSPSWNNEATETVLLINYLYPGGGNGGMEGLFYRREYGEYGKFAWANFSKKKLCSETLYI